MCWERDTWVAWGFIPYGEISPMLSGPRLSHNQTMTITTSVNGRLRQ